MRGFYRLVNFEFSRMLKGMFVLCLGLILVQRFLLYLSARDINQYGLIERFEDIYASSGASIVFLLFLILLLCYFLFNFYSHYWGSKSIYTYLTLPVKREVFYFSKLTVFIICLLMFLTAQLVAVYWGYHYTTAKIDRVTEGQYVMENGLFLAFIRSEFLSTLFPLTLNGMISTISIFIALLTGTMYGAICERQKRFAG